MAGLRLYRTLIGFTSPDPNTLHQRFESGGGSRLLQGLRRRPTGRSFMPWTVAAGLPVDLPGRPPHVYGAVQPETSRRGGRAG
jgi:hypothetical protein